MSIARVWRGLTDARDAQAYTGYLEATGVRELRETPGNERVLVFRRVAGERAEFLVISLWRDMPSIRAFAGPAPARARYFPDDERFLVEMAPHARHYEVPIDDS